MKSKIFILLSSIFLLALSGCTSAGEITDQTDKALNEFDEPAGDVVISAGEITVQTDKAFNEFDEPAGHIVTFTGAIDETYTFLFAVEDTDEEADLIEGEELYRDGFYWAGIQSDIVFIRTGDTLQIQEYVTYEFEDPLPPTVFETIELPSGATLVF